jgi:hypothetical protein
MDLFQNISNNFFLLHKDFLGFSINFSSIGYFLLHIFIAVILFSIFYLLGDKLRKLFFKEETNFTFFIAIALGYISVATGMGLLGVFSLLKPEIIVAYLILLCCLALAGRTIRVDKAIKWIREIRGIRIRKGNFIVWGVLLFVMIAFLRLMTPEITEDGYHTDIPKLFLTSHTTILQSREGLHTIPFPKLPEMIYAICIFLGDKESVRFIHFGFYIVVVSLLFTFIKQKEYSSSKFLPFLFVTAPVVIRYSSTQYIDFFAIFPFLLSIFLIKKKMSKRGVVLSGILFGAVVSAKMWMLVYLPALLLYLIILNKRSSIKRIFTVLGLFISGYVSVVCLWYIRSFMISGNPIFPILNPLFIKEQPYEINPIPYLNTQSYLSFNWEMFTYQNLIVLSPFFFIGICSLFYIYIKKKYLSLTPLFILFVIFTCEQLIIRVAWGRYLLMWFITSSVIAAPAIYYLYRKSRLYRYSIAAVYFIFFSYYLLNTLLVLPYGLGWADKNAYLTRVLYRDNASYYDFDHLFSKHISDKDLVATYDIGNFYYADFKYIDIGYIYNNKSMSFDLLKKRGVTRVLVKGGDIDWFCKELHLSKCNKNKVQLLATYPQGIGKYNLYSIVLPAQK